MERVSLDGRCILMGDYPFFPVFIDLSEKKILVIGAGKIARRRITVLCQFTPELIVIAPETLPEVDSLAADGKIRLIKRAFEEDYRVYEKI